MSSRLQLVAVFAIAALLVVIFELVRRRRLMERYALLWIFSATALLCLAAWGGALERLSSAIGIFYAPSAFFAAGFGFVLALLLHFSLVVSRLVEQNKVLAQQVGQLHQRIDRLTQEQRARPRSHTAHDDDALDFEERIVQRVGSDPRA